jgi:hypothetical protein
MKLNSIQRTMCNGFNINHLETTNFNSFQYEMESGSGPGGRPQGSPLDSTSQIAKVLNGIELRGFQRRIFTLIVSRARLLTTQTTQFKKVLKANFLLGHLVFAQMLHRDDLYSTTGAG